MSDVGGSGGEIVFIDAGIQDLQTALAGVKPGVQVVVLDGTHDALDQIASALDGQHNLSAIHIISEGQPGQLDFTSGSVTLDSQGSHGADLSAIGHALGAGGDLMLWGCNVGQGDTGAAFVSAISHYTNADVAASTDLTGGAAHGGNWTLEAHTGTIETSSSLATEAQSHFTSELANTTLTAVQTTTLTTDTDGDGQFDPGEGVTTSVVITNTGAADATGVSFNETLSGMTQQGGVTITPIAFDDSSYTLTGNTPITISAGSGLLANDIDPDSATPFSNVGLTIAAASTGVHATAHGSVNISSDGSFTYTPNTGFEGTDTFTYTVHDAQGLNSDTTGTVTLTVGEDIWYVDSAASAGGDGSFGHAFQTIAAATAVDTTNDTIFVSNSGSTYSAASGITLLSGEKLLGDGSSLTSVNGHTIGASASNATFLVTGANANAVTLNSGNTVEGISITTTSGTTGNAIVNSGSAGTFHLVNVGVIATGNGITLTGGGTVDSTGINTISSSGNTALNVAGGTQISSANLTFKSISATGGSSGVILNNTGTGAGNGGLIVTGDAGASNNGSGGTIQNSTGVGISLTSTKGVSLSYLNITNSGTHGIAASSVAGFSLNRSNITDNAGDSAVDNGVGLTNTTGAVSFTNDSITASRHQGIFVDNLETNMASLTISGTTVSGALGGDGILIQMRGSSTLTTGTINNNTLSNNTSTGLQVSNSSNGAGHNGNIASLTVQNNAVSGNNAGMDFDLSQASSMTVNVLSNTFTNQHSHAVNLFTDSTGTGGTMTAKIQGNTIGSQGTVDSGSAIGDGIRVVLQGGAHGEVTVDNNQIHEVPNASGVDVIANGAPTGTVSGGLDIKISNNTIFQPTGTNQSLGGPVHQPVPNPAIFIIADRFNSASDPNNTVHAVISGNTAYDPGIWQPGFSTPGAYYLGVRSNATFQLEGTHSGATAEIIATNTVSNDNNGNASDNIVMEEGDASVPIIAPGTSGPFPQIVAPGGVESDPTQPDPAYSGDPTYPATPPSGLIETHLTQFDVSAVLGSAVARWESTGLTAEQDAALHNVSIAVSDLNGMVLGSSTPGHITLDTNGAGHGWFVDGTPNDDAEFPTNSLGTLYTTPDRTPAGHIDLLTTVMHELGHQLGLVDTYSLSATGDLMYGYIVDGARRLPAAGEANGAIPGSITGEEFAVGPVSVGTLPAGKAVTISWLATIDAQINKLISDAVNQGTVSWTNSAGAINTNTVTTTLDTLTLGNQVFKDLNANGVFDGADTGVTGVALTLYADTNANGTYDAGTDTQVTTTTTGAGGAYSFAGLAPGNYIVQVNQSNFNSGGALEGFHATVAGATDPDDNTNADNNGIAVVTNGVVSQAITLAYNTETTNGTGNDTNNTFDIGVISSAPTLESAGSTALYTENAAGTVLESAIAVTELDPSFANLNGATVTISANFTTGDTLNFTDQNGIHGVYAAGTLTLSGSASLANYQTALQSVTFSSTSDNPTSSSTSRTITWGVDNGGAVNHASNGVTTTVTITAVNDAPTLGGAGNTIGYTEQAAAIVVDNGLTVSDPDSATLTGATVTILGNLQSGDTLHFTNQLGISFVSYVGGVLTLSGTTTLANYQSALRTVTFDNTTNDNPTALGTATTRTITWVGNDGAGANNLSTGVTTTINITVVDDPAVAQNDAFTTTEAVVLGAGLSLFNDNGSGADHDVDGPALGVGAVNGSGASVGTQITTAKGALLTVNADGSFSYDPTGSATILALHLAAPGTGAANTTTSDSFTYALAGGNTVTVSLTVNGVNNANTIYNGTGGNDTITGDATLGGLYHLDQGGNDTVTGGSGNDGFYFGAAFDGNDHVNSGGGTNNQLGLEGDYSGGVTLDGAQVQNVQVLAMLPGFNYTISTLDNLVPAGQTFTFWSVSMGAANHVSIDGHLESDGKFQFFLGQGNDTAIGGSGNDVFYGEGGADTLTGNGGADTFAYLQVTDSHGNANGTAYDTVADFTAGTDKLDLSISVSAVDSTVSGSLSGLSFETDLIGSFGSGASNELAAGHAVVFHVTGGGLTGHDFLVVNAHGATGYSAGSDYVFDVTGGTLGGLATSDFI